MFTSQTFVMYSTVIFPPQIFVSLCHLRPDPPIPGQTNGIGSPEQLTGRFQVSAQLSPDSLQALITHLFSLSCPIDDIQNGTKTGFASSFELRFISNVSAVCTKAPRRFHKKVFESVCIFTATVELVDKQYFNCMFCRTQSLWAETRTRTTENTQSPARCHCPLDLIHLIFPPVLMERGRFYLLLPTRGNPLPSFEEPMNRTVSASLHFLLCMFCVYFTVRHKLSATASKINENKTKWKQMWRNQWNIVILFCFVLFFFPRMDFRSAHPLLHCWSAHHWSKERRWVRLHWNYSLNHQPKRRE